MLRLILSLEVGGDLSEFRQGVVVEHFVTLAEIAFLLEPLSVRVAILHASAAADVQIPADKTLVVDALFLSAEIPFHLARSQFAYRRFHYIADPPLLFDKEVAAKDIAVMLDNDIIAALGLKGTLRLSLPDAI